ncbi:MAG: winged helix-turn-helix domain-containing protein [Promethearchaeota archaeon]
MAKKCNLTREEIKGLYKKKELLNEKTIHYNCFRAMANDTRRNLLKYINHKTRTFSDIKKEFKLDENQLKYHLSMLEQCFFIINSKDGWKSTPGALAFLKNVLMKNK